MKWSEVTRSETPINWRELLERVTLTPEKLNAHLQQLIVQRRMEMTDEQKKTEDGEIPVDMPESTEEVLNPADEMPEDDDDIDDDGDDDDDDDIDDDGNDGFDS